MTKKSRNRRVYLRAAKKLRMLMAENAAFIQKPREFPISFLTSDSEWRNRALDEDEKFKYYNWNVLGKMELRPHIQGGPVIKALTDLLEGRMQGTSV